MSSSLNTLKITLSNESGCALSHFSTVLTAISAALLFGISIFPSLPASASNPNSYTPRKTSVTVTKRWDDANNQDGKRPNSIKVQLYADDEKEGDEVELTDRN